MTKRMKLTEGVGRRRQLVHEDEKREQIDERLQRRNLRFGREFIEGDKSEALEKGIPG